MSWAEGRSVNGFLSRWDGVQFLINSHQALLREIWVAVARIIPSNNVMSQEEREFAASNRGRLVRQIIRLR